MSFGSTAAGGAEALVTGAKEVIRWATGCDLASWPRAAWQQTKISAEIVSRRDIGQPSHIQSTKATKHRSTKFFPRKGTKTQRKGILGLCFKSRIIRRLLRQTTFLPSKSI